MLESLVLGKEDLFLDDENDVLFDQADNLALGQEGDVLLRHDKAPHDQGEDSSLEQEDWLSRS